MSADLPPELDSRPSQPRRHVWDRAPFRIIAGTAIFLILILLVLTAYNIIGDSDDEPSGLRPGIGDHWHATHAIWICDVRQPNLERWEGGIHTHSDGIMHIHPFTNAEEGPGAALGKFFEYGGGVLSGNEMQVPGSDTTFTDGDTCPDGSEASLTVAVNGAPVQDFPLYVPQDGDDIVIFFGPEGSAPTYTPEPTDPCLATACTPTPAGPTPPPR